MLLSHVEDQVTAFI